MSLFDDLPEESAVSKSASIPNLKNNVEFMTLNKTNSKNTLINNAELPLQIAAQSESVKRKADENCTSDLERTNNGVAVSKILKQETLIGLSSFAHGRKGERDEMQDYHVIFDDISHDLPDTTKTYVRRVAYYAVFDGHAGARASKMAAERLHKIFLEKFPRGNEERVEKEMKKCLVDSFRKMDEEFLQQASKQKPFWKDGTTATVIVIVNNTLYVANIGDSKAIMCREDAQGAGGPTPVVLTRDHNPTLYEERMRIQKSGGTVRDGRVSGVLEVSRSIGDGQYKVLGVTCVPDVRRCSLTGRDKYVLVACDGLWKSFSNHDAVAYIQKIFEDRSPGRADVRPETDVCSRLSAEAVKRLSGDNVTVLLVRLTHSS